MPRVRVVFLARGSYTRAGRVADGVHYSPARSSDAAPSKSAWLGRHCRARHGRQQPDDLPDHGAVRRSGSDPRARQRRRPVAHYRGSARLGRGTCLDRARPDVAEPGRRNLGGLRRSLPALQPGARGADRHLLLVGLGADLRLDRSALCLSLPALVLPRASGRSCGHHHRLLFQLRELWPIDCSMPWQSHSRCAASKSPSGSASAARSIPKTRPTSMR